MAAAGGDGGSFSLLGSATTWPLKRYGRFLPPAEGDDEGQNTSSWKVFESNEESGHLVLTIVVSGHFFISQGRAVLEYGIDELTASCPSGYPSYKTWYWAHVCCEDKLNVLGQELTQCEALWYNCSSWDNPNLEVSFQSLKNKGGGMSLVKQPGSAIRKVMRRDCAEKGCAGSDADNSIDIRSACDQPNGMKRTCLKRLHQILAMMFTAVPWVDKGPLQYIGQKPGEEGFSLIDSHKWLKIVRRADCLLLRAHSKNECRLFRVQFGGDSKEQTLERCCRCVQKLAEYVPVQVADEQNPQLDHSLHPLGNGDNQEQDTEQNASALLMPDEPLPDSCTSLGERRSLTQLAQRVLKQAARLPTAAQRPAWRAQELRPFIRLCLLDHNFPAFVEDVEKELRKLAEG